MRPENFTAKIGANLNEFRRKMKEVDSLVKKTAMGTDKPIGADISRFLRKAAEVAVVSRALAREKIIVPIDARINKFQSQMDRIATTIRTFSTVISNQLGGAFMAISPAAVPVIASLIGALGNIGPMIGTVAGSTFALATAFGIAGTAAVGLGAAAIPTIQGIFGETEKLSAAQAAARAEYDKTASTWQRIVKSVEQPVLDGFSQSMEIARKVLASVEPMFVNAANAVNGLLTSLNKQIGGQELQDFFKTLNTYAGPMITVLGEGLGFAFKGLMNMMTAFAPLAQSTAEGFRGMMERFAEWSNGLSGSEKFQKFVDYVNTNMPKVRSIFRDAISGIVHLFAGFGDSSSGMMDGLVDMMSRFKKWASNLENNQGFQNFIQYIQENGPKVVELIGNIATFIGNLGKSLAPLGSRVLEIVNSFLSWTNSMMESNSWIGKVVGYAAILGGAFMALVPTIVSITTLFGGFGSFLVKALGGAFGFIKGLFTNFKGTIGKVLAPIAKIFSKLKGLRVVFAALSGPVGIAIAAIMLLIPVIKRLWNENEGFRNGVLKAWNAIKTGISTAVQFVSDFISNVWGTITTWWEENQEKIKSSAQAAWDYVYEKVVTGLTAAWNFIKQIWGTVSSWWDENQDLVKESTSIAWDFIKTQIVDRLQQAWDFIKNVFNIMQPFIQTAWEFIKVAASSTWEFIKSTVSTAINLVLGVIKAVMLMIKGDWQGVWDEIKNILSTVWTYIKDLVKIGIDFVKGILSAGWELVKELTSKAWTAIKNKISEIWDSIKAAIEFKVNQLKSNLEMRWAMIKMNTVRTVQEIKDKVVNFFTDKVNSVREKMDQAKQWISDKWEEAKSLATSILETLIRTVKTSFTKVVGAVREKMSEAVDKVSEYVGEMPGKVTAFVSDMISAGGDLIGGVISGITGKVGEAFSAVQSFGSDLLSKFKSSIGVKSPSRKFAAIAKYIPPGVAKGVKQKAKLAIGSVERLASSMSRAFRPELADVGVSAKLDTAISPSDMRVVKHAFSAEMESFELEDRDIVINLDGREVGRATAKHVKAENDLQDRMRKQGSGYY